MSQYYKSRNGSTADNPSRLNTTIDTFQHEIKNFWNARTVSRLTFIAFGFLNLANVLSIVVMAAPGWGWTHEVAGTEESAGEYYGYYGVWYACWTDVTGIGRRHVCDFITSGTDVPGWWTSFKALSVMTLICGFFTFIAMMTYMCVVNLNKNTNIILTGAVMAGLAGLFCSSWFLLFGIGFIQTSWQCCHPDVMRQFIDYRLFYNFVLCIVCALFYFAAMVAGIFEAIEIKKEYKRLLAIQERFERESQWEQSSIAPSVRFPLPAQVHRPVNMY